MCLQVSNKSLPVTSHAHVKAETEVWGANNFGALRLMLAIAVIFGHSPELIDGNRSREPLTQLFGTLSLGETAVDGFFLISGYLLTSSLMAKPALVRYFLNRATRIYPGFIVAFLVCVVIVAPLAGGKFLSESIALRNMARVLLLQPPLADGAFDGLREPALNGAMWTICYEFGCYIILATLSVVGLLRRPWLLVAGTSVLLVLLLLRVRLDSVSHHIVLFGLPQNVVRFVSAFLWGSVLKVLLTPQRRGLLLAAGCGCITLLALNSRWLAEPALIVLGGVLLICIAEYPFSRTVALIGVRQDVSYGVYLYAWPLQNLLIWRFGVTQPLLLSILTLGGTLLLGLLSWTLIESPVMRLCRTTFLLRRSPANWTANHDTGPI